MELSTGFAGSQDQLLATLRAFVKIGADGVHLIPTSDDVEQRRAVAEVVADLWVS